MGKIPDHPRFGCAKSGATLINGLLEFGVMLPSITKFGSGKITIQNESCFLAEGIMIYLTRDGFTNFDAAFILPDDSRSQRFTRFVIPYDKCFALVIKSHCGNIIFLDQRSNRFFHSPNDIGGILLDPTWAGKTRR